MADSKKAHFSKSPILKIFSRKFLRFVLGLVGLNDAKGIDVAQLIWPWGSPTKAQKQPKTAIYVELNQCPSHHSILLTQGPIWEIFAKKFWELAILKNELFLSQPFWIFFLKKIIFFCLIPWKKVKVSWIAGMGRNFDDYPGFQLFRSWANTYAQDCTCFWQK